MLAEPCADLAALPKGAGGRTTQLKETPLRLCVFAFFFLSPQTLGLKLARMGVRPYSFPVAADDAL